MHNTNSVPRLVLATFAGLVLAGFLTMFLYHDPNASNMSRLTASLIVFIGFMVACFYSGKKLTPSQRIQMQPWVLLVYSSVLISSGYEVVTKYSNIKLAWLIAFSLIFVYGCYQYYRDRKLSVGSVSK